jgi:hypothetical protein
MAAAALGGLVLYFAVSAWDGLHAYFTFDDGGNLLNLHKYFESSPGVLLKSLVNGSYRPMGGLFYVILFQAAGFNPLPFRVVCFALMLVNVCLAFAVLRRLSGSVEAALIGTLVLAHHPALLNLDYSTGCIYEILCFLFYFLALWCYLRWRQESPESRLSGRRLAVLLLLSACALDSKEMAVTLPFAVLLVELVYLRPLSSVRRHAGAAMALALLVLAVMLQKLLTFNGLSSDPRYAMHFSPRMVLDQMCRYYDLVIYRFQYLTIPGLLLLWTVMALAAYGLRSRPMQYGFWFLMAGLMPMALIYPRTGVAAYLPMVGWALYIGSLAVRLSEVSLRMPVLRFAAMLVVVMFLILWHARQRAPFVSMIHHQQGEERRVIRQLKERHPHLAPGSYLLFLDDPFPAQSWVLPFFTRLAYGDPTLWVDRARQLGRVPTGEELTLYDYILTDDRGQVRDVRALQLFAPRPAIAVHLSPSRVRPGQTYTVSIPEYAGETIDVAFQTRVRESGVVRAWCTLDSSGRATLETPQTMEAGEISVRRIRAGRGPWVPAVGVIEVVR